MRFKIFNALGRSVSFGGDRGNILSLPGASAARDLENFLRSSLTEDSPVGGAHLAQARHY